MNPSRNPYPTDVSDEEWAFVAPLEVVKLPETKRGFVLLPSLWVVERSFDWATRFRRLVRDDERLPATLAGLHLVAFACLMLHQRMAFSSP